MVIITDANRIIELGAVPTWHAPSAQWFAKGQLWLRDRGRFSNSVTYHRFKTYAAVHWSEVQQVAKANPPKRKRIRYRRARIVDGIKKWY